MAENFNLGRIRSEDSSIYFGTGLVLGLNDISIQNNLGTSPLQYISQGNKRTFEIVNSEQYADVGINSIIINRDEFIQFTGSQPVNAYILKDKNLPNSDSNYFLISGYLSSYNSSYSIGQPPQVNTTFRFYNSAGKIQTGELNSKSKTEIQQIINNVYTGQLTGVLLPSYQTTNVTCNDGENNRILSYEISLEMNRIPVYNIGTRNPRRVELIYPIECLISYSIDASNLYSGVKLSDLPRNPQTQSISIVLNDYNSNAQIASYSFQNLNLVNESAGFSVDGNRVITKEFQAYITD